MKEDTRSRYEKYVKVCFLAMKGKQRDREPSPFGPFLLTEMTHSYTSASEISTRFYT